MRMHGMVGAAVVWVAFCAGGLGTARGQETISGEVWLGSTLFTVEDLEQLTDAARLTEDQQAAALELMRGGMARARTLALRTYRGADEMEWSGDAEEQAKQWAALREKQRKQLEEVVEVEKSVMSDLKSLLEGEQVDEGWAKFERSRRRLLLRSVEQVQQQLAMRQAQSATAGVSYSYHYGQDRGVPDLIATIRASKLGAEDLASVGTIVEQYASSMDSALGEYRRLAKPLLKGQQMGYWSSEGEETVSDGDVEKLQDTITKMKATHVKFARQVDEALAGEARARFMRQRLRAEFQWEWQPSGRMPQVKSVMKLRSLSKEQRAEIKGLVKKADEALLDVGAANLRDRDAMELSGKAPENPWEFMQGEAAQERVKQDQRIRKQLVKDVVAVLNEEQKAAYETGIENDQDLVDAFEKRRHGQQAWGLDQDLNAWDWMDQQEEDEE